MADLIHSIKKAGTSPALAPWLIGHRLTTFAGYRLGPVMRDSVFPPETVNIYPTTRCNLKCSMCFEKFYRSGTELNLSEWLRIIGDIKRFHPRVHLSGGEPFIYEDILKLITAIKKSGLFLHITTNGVYLKDYAAELVKLKVNRLDISIDGPEEIHDKVRGVKGTYAAILQGFRKIGAIKKNRQLPELKINSIINLAKPDTMRDICRLAQEFGIGTVQFIHPLFLDSEAIGKHRLIMKENLGMELNYWLMANRFKPAVDNIDAVLRVLNELEKIKSIAVEIFPRLGRKQMDVYYHQRESFASVYSGNCRAMWHTATILPDGIIESCPDYVLGDCHQHRLTDVWNSETMRDLRRRIRKKHFFSVCQACCFYYQ